MKIKIRNINMYEQIGDRDTFKVFKSTITTYLNIIKYLNSNSVDSLTNDAFIKIINTIYKINLDDYDLLSLISIKLNRSYGEFKDINIMDTNNVYKTAIYSWYDSSCVYSKSKYLKLASNKDIVPIACLMGDNTIPNLGINSKEDFDKFILNNQDLYAKLLRKRFSNRKILADTEDIFIELATEVNDFLGYLMNTNMEDYEKCSNWFNKNQCKNNIKLLKK